MRSDRHPPPSLGRAAVGRGRGLRASLDHDSRFASGWTRSRCGRMSKPMQTICPRGQQERSRLRPGGGALVFVDEQRRPEPWLLGEPPVFASAPATRARAPATNACDAGASTPGRHRPIIAWRTIAPDRRMSCITARARRSASGGRLRNRGDGVPSEEQRVVSMRRFRAKRSVSSVGRIGYGREDGCAGRARRGPSGPLADGSVRARTAGSCSRRYSRLGLNTTRAATTRLYDRPSQH
jgi:hypothetical protein